MKVRYFTNACVLIETPDLRILCDPWFTDGAYDGSWYHWPPIDYDPIETIGAVDVIWVSHVHPDHYDPTFLDEYLAEYPDTTLLVGLEYLAAIMRRDGFFPLCLLSWQARWTRITTVPSSAWEVDDIDSALIVQSGDQTVVNMNDCPNDAEQITKILGICREPTLALLPFAGAGPIPQTFIGYDRDALLINAGRKAQTFLDGFGWYRDALRPKHAVPFAGQYLLGGKNYELNSTRGLLDPVVVEGGLVPAALAWIDVESGEMTAKHIPQVSNLAMEAYAASLADRPMAWETCPQSTDGLVPLLNRAAGRALKIGQPTGPFALETETDRYTIGDGEAQFTILVPEAYLRMLLTGASHWDTAIVGSNLRVQGSSDVYGRTNRVFFNHFYV